MFQWGLMMKRFSRNNEAELDELGSNSGQVGSDSAGQSGDTQGLSHEANAAEESVEELAATNQPYEAGIAEGVEDAEDHPQRPVYAREDKAKAAEIPSKLA
jgi:hypothetical protein